MDEYTAWHHMNTRLHASKVFITEVGGVKEKNGMSHVTNQLISIQWDERHQVHDAVTKQHDIYSVMAPLCDRIM